MARKGLFDMADPFLLTLKEKVFRLRQSIVRYRKVTTKYLLTLMITLFFIAATLVVVFDASLQYWLCALFIILFGLGSMRLIYSIAKITIRSVKINEVYKFIREREASQIVNTEDVVNTTSNVDEMIGMIRISSKIMNAVYVASLSIIAITYVIIAIICIFEIQI